MNTPIARQVRAGRGGQSEASRCGGRQSRRFLSARPSCCSCRSCREASGKPPAAEGTDSRGRAVPETIPSAEPVEEDIPNAEPVEDDIPLAEPVVEASGAVGMKGGLA